MHSLHSPDFELALIFDFHFQLKQVKGMYSWFTESRGNGTSLTMGSRSVTCHPTQVNAPRLNPSQEVGTRFTHPEGWKAELT